MYKLSNKIILLTIISTLLTPLTSYAKTHTLGCSDYVDNSTYLSVTALEKGAKVCAKAKRQPEANFLTITARIRKKSNTKFAKPFFEFGNFSVLNGFDRGFNHELDPFARIGFADIYQTKLKTDKIFADLEKSFPTFDINHKPNLSFNNINKNGTSVSFQQLYKGYNGLRYSKMETFQSANKVKNSWLAKALDKGELNKLLTQINFDKKMLIALNFGQYSNATQNFSIEKVLAHKSYQGVHISAKIGLANGSCASKQALSAPFILVTVDKQANDVNQTSTGYFIKSFDDGCKEVISGKVTVID